MIVDVTAQEDLVFSELVSSSGIKQLARGFDSELTAERTTSHDC